jgi:Putative lumazine-binding
MNKTLILVLTISALATVAQAQNADQEAAKQPILQLFEGMKKSDSTMAKQAFAPGARLETVQNKAGVVSVQNTDLAKFFVAIASAPSGALDERLTAMEIKVDGEMATAWTPYQFFYKGQFSHGGVNAFQLVKLANGWKIWSIIDTRRK